MREVSKSDSVENAALQHGWLPVGATTNHGTVRQSTDPRSAQLQLLERAVASTENGVTITDVMQPDSPLIYVNPAFLRLTGYSAKDVLGRNCRFLQGPDVRQPGIDILRDAISAGGETTVLLHNFRADGAEFWNELTVSPVRDGAGQLTHYIGIQHDVTGRRQAELDIQNLNGQLERRSVSLQDAYAEMEKFSYSVSHDLRAPLAAIEGFCTALRDELSGGTPKAAHYLSRIAAGVVHMTALVDAMLTLSKVSSADLVVGECDLGAIAQRLLDSYAARDPHRTVRVHIDQDMFALADIVLVEAVLDNLLSNAWKFTARQVDAQIRFGSCMSSEGVRTFEVQDNGAGFDMVYADKLFNTFQRLHSAQEFPGIGIGLATVRRIVERHGGRIWAESAPGAGATFYFELG